MGHQTIPFYALNRGEISRLALARVDVERLRLAAETQVNFLPRVLGPASLRPGTSYITEVRNSAPCRYLPFIFGVSDTALLEFTDHTLRILVNEAPIVRPAIGTTLAGFSATPANGANVSISGTQISMAGHAPATFSTAVSATQIAPDDQPREHALRIHVTAGPIHLRIGSTNGGEEIFGATSLNTGIHSLAFTPKTGTIYIRFESAAYALRAIGSIGFEGAGEMILPSPYSMAMLADLSFETSADVMFVAGGGIQPRRLERHGARSYAICLYQTLDGPFPGYSGDSSTLISPSGYQGNITLSANRPVFSQGHVNALVRLFQTGQNNDRNLVAQDTWSLTIRVSGVSKVSAAGASSTTATTDRNFSVITGGNWGGTLTLQRSMESASAGFTDYKTYTGNTSDTIVDSLDNIVCWYRIGFKAGDYGSGQASVSLRYSGGGAAGIARITSYIDATTVAAEVIKPFSNTSAANDWRLSEWSDRGGWPTAVAIHEGRLWFAGQTKIWASVSDGYDSFDMDKTGDAGPIDRSIGHGPIQNINWLLPLTRLVMGGDCAILSARSNSFDEPLTPSVFTLKDSLTIAASSLPAVKHDTSGFFVSQSGRKIYNMAFDVQVTDFKEVDLTRLNPEIGQPGFVDIAIQREPDTRLHLVRGDGQVACLVYDRADQVEAWYRIVTDGLIENVVTLPGTLESRVYYVVARSINGVTKRYLERCARIDECVGATLSKNIDCHGIYQGAATQTITGLSFLEGKDVVVWADGKEVGLDPTNPGDPATYRVTGGQITLPVPVSQAVVGLPYQGHFKSAKLAYAAAEGTALNQVKRIDHLGLHLTDTHAMGLKFGPDFDTLDDLPRMEEDAVLPVDTIHSLYDDQMIEFPGSYHTDARICLQAQSPRPCTVLGFTIEIRTHG